MLNISLAVSGSKRHTIIMNNNNVINNGNNRTLRWDTVFPSCNRGRSSTTPFSEWSLMQSIFSKQESHYCYLQHMNFSLHRLLLGSSATAFNAQSVRHLRGEGPKDRCWNCPFDHWEDHFGRRGTQPSRTQI